MSQDRDFLDGPGQGSQGTPPFQFVTRISGTNVVCWMPGSFTIDGVKYVLTKQRGKGDFSTVFFASSDRNGTVALKLQRYISPIEKNPPNPQLRKSLLPRLLTPAMEAQPYTCHSDPSIDNIPDLERKERERCLKEMECTNIIKERCQNADLMCNLAPVNFFDFFVDCFGYAEFLMPIVPVSNQKAQKEGKPTWLYPELHFGVRVCIGIFEACEDSADAKLERLDETFLLHERVNCALQIAQALEIVRRCGIQHRDLKAANVMLHKGRWKLIDFGISHLNGTAPPSTAAYRHLNLSKSASSNTLPDSGGDSSSDDLSFWSQFILQLLMEKNDADFDEWKEEEENSFGKKRPEATKADCDAHFANLLLEKASEFKGLNELIEGCIYNKNYLLLESSVYMTWRSVLDENYEADPSSLTLEGLLMFIAKQGHIIPVTIFARTLALLRQMIENSPRAFSDLLEKPSVLSDITDILRMQFNHSHTEQQGTSIDGLLILERCLSHFERSMSYHQLRNLQRELDNGKIVQFITQSLNPKSEEKRSIPNTSLFAAVRQEPSSPSNTPRSKVRSGPKPSSSNDFQSSPDPKLTSPTSSFSSQHSSGDLGPRSPYSSGNLSAPSSAVATSFESKEAENDPKYLVVRIVLLLCANNATYRDRFFKTSDAKANFSFCLNLIRKYNSFDTMILLFAAPQNDTFKDKILGSLGDKSRTFIDEQFEQLHDRLKQIDNQPEVPEDTVRQVASLVRLYARTGLKFWRSKMNNFRYVKNLQAFFRTVVLPHWGPYLFRHSNLDLLKQRIPELNWDVHHDLILHIVPRLSCYRHQPFNQSIRSLCLNSLQYPDHIGATELVQWAMKFEAIPNCKCSMPDLYTPAMDPATLRGEFLCLVCAEKFQVICKNCFQTNMKPFLAGYFVCANHLPSGSASPHPTQITESSPEDGFEGCCGWSAPINSHWIPTSDFDHSIAPSVEQKGVFSIDGAALTCSTPLMELSTIQIIFIPTDTASSSIQLSPSSSSIPSSSSSPSTKRSEPRNGSGGHSSQPRSNTPGTLKKFIELKIATPGQTWLGLSSKKLFDDDLPSPTFCLGSDITVPFLAYDSLTGDLVYSSEYNNGAPYIIRSRHFGFPLETTSHLGVGLAEDEIYFIADCIALPRIDLNSLIGFPRDEFRELIRSNEGIFTVSMSSSEDSSTVLCRRYTESRPFRSTTEFHNCPLEDSNVKKNEVDRIFPPGSLAHTWYSLLTSHNETLHQSSYSPANGRSSQGYTNSLTASLDSQPTSTHKKPGNLSNSTPARAKSTSDRKSKGESTSRRSASSSTAIISRTLEVAVKSLKIQPENQQPTTTNNLD